VTKLQVPVMYAIFVLDLKILWETKEELVPVMQHPVAAD